MFGRRSAAFPFEAVEDLLGLTRAMYASGIYARPEIQRIGRNLEAALKLARADRGPRAQRTAWDQALEATEDLGNLVRIVDGAEPIVHAAMARVLGRHVRGRPSPR